MKFTKKCIKNTKPNQSSIISSISKRRSSADRLITSSSVSAVTSLILMLGLCILASLAINPAFTYAIGTVSLTVSSGIVDLDLAPTSASGNFGKSNNIDISATTDNSTGYVLGIAASSATNYDKLINSNDNTCDNIGTNEHSISGFISSNCLNSVNTATSEATFSDASSTSYNGLWGYLPSKYNSLANTNFYPAPTANGDTIEKTNAANPTAISYTLAIGARVSNDIKIDSYDNAYIITLIANAVPYTITYNGSLVANMPPDVSDTTESSTVNISSLIPTREGYEFQGWCTVKVADGAACTGTTYSAGQAWTLGTSGNDLHLYAMWQKVAPATPYIQDYTLATCAAEASYNVTVKDKRDNNEYTVHYINGACWMTQNLRYLGDTGSAAGTMTIGNNNSNVSNKDITLYSLNSSNAGNFNAYSGHCDSTNGYNYACVYDSGSETTGVWYNYYAASGGTISGSNNSTAATNDICPSGWHLPSGPNTTSGTDYNKLIGNTTSGWQNSTAGLILFGAVAGGKFYNGSLLYTNDGHWWSATASNATSRYYLRYSSSDGQFKSNVSYYRYSGFFVRCVRSS